MKHLPTVVLLGLLLPVNLIGQSAGNTPLDGTWRLLSVDMDEEVQKITEPRFVWVLKAGRVYYAGEEYAQVTLNEETNPRSIDLAFGSPRKVLEGIYQVDENILKVCINRQAEGIKERPGAFSTKGKSEWRLLTFERLGKGDNPTEGLGGRVGLVLGYTSDKKNVLIVDVQKGTPAEKAGLKKDDVLLQVGALDAVELVPVVMAIRRASPGTEIAFRIRRGENERTIPVKAGVLPFYFLD